MVTARPMPPVPPGSRVAGACLDIEALAAEADVSTQAIARVAENSFVGDQKFIEQNLFGDGGGRQVHSAR
jgi:hypothetical protein